VWSASEFDGFRHGYAGTIYKGQGKTLDHTYLYHSHHWRQASSYVALTRQRESAQIFVATETARDIDQLARQMSRGEVRSASVAWLTHDELPPQLRRAAAVGGAHLASAEGHSDQAAIVRTNASRGASTPRDGPGAIGVPEHGWWIAPRNDVVPVDRGEVAAAVAADPQARREREALGRYVAGAYRDPREAHSRLSELIKTHGHTSAAQRLAADPQQLGELQGKVGLLAGGAGRQERVRAERVAQAVGPAVARIGEAEGLVAAMYRSKHEADRVALATGVPRLSERAQAALRMVSGALDSEGRARAWTALQGSEALAGEVKRFGEAVRGRFGIEGVRTLERSGTLVEAKLTSAEAAKLGEIGRYVKAVGEGGRAVESLVQKLAAAQRLGSGLKVKP
jgi:hypothetical protein